MTQQDDITQRVLTDDELMALLPGAVRLPPGWKDTARAIESAVLSKLRAPVTDERRCEHCDGTGDVHSIDGEWRGTCICPAGRALASAPVAVEQHDGLRTLLAELPGMHEDPKKGDAVFRCGVNGALNVVERRIRELLRSAPVAGEAIGYVDSLYLACRQRGLPCFGTIHHTPTSDATAPVYAAPQASAEDVRNAALEEAAHLMEQTGKRIAASDIRSLKTQADKDGCTCPSGGGSLRHPCPMHPGADKDGGQQRAGDDDLLRFAWKAIRAELDPQWECNSHHPMLYAAEERLRAALSAPQAEQGERDAK